ncbi:DUF4239 domain-containing protein [Streptomyces flaveus]|uniref:bestrophin-like domain n=1 Tax=Streptomyces flaveus TaxID=66370 RepID=UPI003328B233
MLVVLVTGGTALVQACVRRYFPSLRNGKHNDIAGFLLAVVGVVYAFIISFIAFNLWEQITTEYHATQTEASMVLQLAQDADVFDDTASSRIRQSALTYTRSVVAEWPTAATGHTTAEADRALEGLYTTYEELEPGNDTQRAFIEKSQDSLRELSILRTERVLDALQETGPTSSLWVVILLASALTLGFSVIFGLEDARLHYGMVGAMSVLVATNLFLILELSYPFLGELSASPESMQTVIQAIQALDTLQ